MTLLTIDPRNRPLRGIRAIAEYIGQDPQLTRHQLLRGRIDADRDGKLFVTTPAPVDASLLIVGRSPIREAAFLRTSSARPKRTIDGAMFLAEATLAPVSHEGRSPSTGCRCGAAAARPSPKAPHCKFANHR